MEDWRYSSTHFTLSTRWMQVSASFTLRHYYSEGTIPQYPSDIQASMWAPEMFSKLPRADYLTKAYIKMFISEENYNTAVGNKLSSHSQTSTRLIFWRGGEGRDGWLNKHVVLFRKVKAPSGYIKCGKYLDWTGNYQLFKKGSAHRN
jgi:hypothetical protein